MNNTKTKKESNITITEDGMHCTFCGIDFNFTLSDVNWLLVKVEFDHGTRLGMIRDIFMANGEDIEPYETLIDENHYAENEAYERLLELSRKTGLKIATMSDYDKQYKNKDNK